MGRDRMTGFEKTMIGWMGASAAALVFFAAGHPNDGATRSPNAVLVQDSEMATAAGGRMVMAPAITINPTVEKATFTVKTLSKTFTSLGYDIEMVRSGSRHVPHYFADELPVDMPHIQAPARRKVIFFKTVLPLVLRVNAEISVDRKRLTRLEGLRREDQKLAAEDRLWLAALAERYNVDRDDFEEFLKRVDIVPASLALAQAAAESGWGTSRFVREGNALFGQWTFTKVGSLLPGAREKGKTHRVKSFSALIDGVRAYVNNLNTHRAYRAFRTERRNARRSGAPLDGHDLARALTSYSERGKDYVRDIQTIINVNRLRQLDKARLGEKAEIQTKSLTNSPAKPVI